VHADGSGRAADGGAAIGEGARRAAVRADAAARAAERPFRTADPLVPGRAHPLIRAAALAEAGGLRRSADRAANELAGAGADTDLPPVLRLALGIGRAADVAAGQLAGGVADADPAALALLAVRAGRAADLAAEVAVVRADAATFPADGAARAA